MDKLESAIVEINYNEIRNLAHNLKGSSGNLRITQIEEVMNHIEQNALNNNINGIASRIIQGVNDVLYR